MKAASRILLVAALMISIGLHWAVVQSVAWVGMAVTYSVKTGSVVQGLSDTFDGEHGCRLCHAVEVASKDSSSKEDSAPKNVVKDLKLHLTAAQNPVFVPVAPTDNTWATSSVTGALLSVAPESPPPRSGKWA
jgi:hypothetical protein